MAVEAEAERVGRSVQPVEVPLELGDAVLRVEPHRLDQVELLAFTVHEGSLEQALGPFIAWLAVHDKPRSEPQPRGRRPVPPFERANEDVERGIPARLDPAHRSRIGAARLGLELAQGLDRGDLGRPGDRPAREDRRQNVDRVEAIAEPRGDPADHLVERREALDREQLGHLDAARLRDPREVVAHQVDDHQILGALLGVCGQRRRFGGIGGGLGPSRRGALHRLGLDHALADGEELLGRQRQDRALVVDDHPAPACPRRAPQPRVERQRVARHRDVAAEGQIGLVIIPREQLLAHLPHGSFIGRALDPRARGRGECAIG